MIQEALKSKPRVLIIDDEAGLREMLVFGLSDRGYQVATAGSGEEGLEKVSTEKFDLVVCDIMMPGVGGVDVLKGVRECSPDTEVIMATGYATLETAVESMKQGAYDYIAKPYGLDQLSVIFEKALERRRLRVQVGHLEEINRLKSEFVATVSQRIQNSVDTIIENTAHLLKGGEGPISKQLQIRLSTIEVQARQLLQAISELLRSRRGSALGDAQ